MLFKTFLPAALVASAAGLVAMPALAQDTGDPLAPPPAANDNAMTPAQQAEYATWPAEIRDYYQSLSAERRKLFWQMDNADKASLVAMSPEDQEAVWQGIESMRQEASPMP